MATTNQPGQRDPAATGSNPGNIAFSSEEKAKHPMSQSEIDKKISESGAGETGDDIKSDKYTKKEPDRGPNFNKYSKQEDGDTSANAGVFK